MPDTDLHPMLGPLAGLIGTWRGAGEGVYPTIDDFAYTEEIVLTPGPGKPFLAYTQRTKGADGLPRHAEMGYWRPVGDGGVELVLAHPTGIVERLVGSATATDGGLVIDLRDDDVAITPAAKSVTATHRRFELDGDVLTYTMAMAAVGEPLTHHLSARLERVTP